VLALLNGVPTWTATTTLATISGTLSLANGGTATTTFYNGGIVFSDSSKLTQAAGSDILAWDNTNGRLGLGTANPGSSLYVLGPTQTDASTSALQIEQHLVALGSQNDLGSGILFRTNNGGSAWNSGSINGVVGDPITGIGGFPGGLAFYTKGADGSATGPMFERMRIDYAGNVGIGRLLAPSISARHA
jgi:hypothetical protein